MEAFVGRQSEASQLKELLGNSAKKGVAIRGIVGPGGVGKSRVFEKALEDIDMDGLGYLKLQISGSNRGNEGSAGELVAAAIDQIVGGLIRSAKGLHINLKPPGFYFPRTRDAIDVVADLRGEVRKELVALGINPEDASDVAKLMKASASIVDRVAVFIPKVREFVNAQAVSDAADHVVPAVEELNALSSGGVSFWEKLASAFRSSLKEAAKQDPEEVLASALVADLESIILGEQSGKLVPGHGKVKRLERLLVVIEDYEALYKQLGGFLLPKFIEKLVSSEMDSTLVILSRMRLEATNPLWKQHKTQLKSIVLKPLDKGEVGEFMDAYGISDPVEHDRAWKDTSGLPFHLALLAEELESGGRSSTALKELYQRVVMWMTPQEISWLHQMLYMDVVRVDTLAQVLGSESEAEAAFDWFEGEGSILDQSAGLPRMLPFVRSRLCEYLEGRNRNKVKELKAKAATVVID